MPKIRHFDHFLFDFTMRQRALGFWLEFRVFPQKLGVKIFFYNYNPPKALPYAKTRLMTHQRSKSVRASDLCGRARTPQKKTKKKKLKREDT